MDWDPADTDHFGIVNADPIVHYLQTLLDHPPNQLFSLAEHGLGMEAWKLMRFKIPPYLSLTTNVDRPSVLSVRVYLQGRYTHVELHLSGCENGVRVDQVRRGGTARDASVAFYYILAALDPHAIHIPHMLQSAFNQWMPDIYASWNTALQIVPETDGYTVYTLLLYSGATVQQLFQTHVEVAQQFHQSFAALLTHKYDPLNGYQWERLFAHAVVIHRMVQISESSPLRLANLQLKEFVFRFPRVAPQDSPSQVALFLIQNWYT